MPYGSSTPYEAGQEERAQLKVGEKSGEKTGEKT